MREIKFRAWNQKQKEMIYSHRGNYMIELDCKCLQFIDVTAKYCNPIPEAILLQFTGLKDKNGKEIYEGDIVKITGHYEHDTFVENTVGYIEFFEGMWIISKDGEYVDDLHSNVINDRVEKIGNKFENTELISQDKTEE